MNRDEVLTRFDRDWSEWAATIGAIDPALTRTPGVCGTWTVHDVVGHVQAYTRYNLTQARGAFSGIAPTRAEINGDRKDWVDGEVDNSLDGRNEDIRVRGLELTWQQQLAECDWLRSSTLEFVGSLSDAALAEPVGWVHFWLPNFSSDPNNVEGLMIRRIRDMPAAADPLPVSTLIQPNEPDKHLTEHLGQITAWLATAR